MPIKRHAGVPLPKNVFRVVKKKSGKQYYYYQERRGQPDKGPLIPLPSDLHDPLFWQKLKEIECGDSGPLPQSFDALIASFKGSQKYKTVHTAATKELYDGCMKHLSAAWGKLLVRDLQPLHIYKLMEARLDRPSMANAIVRVLRVLLRHGIKFGYCNTNVARDIEFLDEAGVGSEPWSEAVYSFVLERAPTLLMRVAVLGRATGQRAVDLVKIR